MSARFGKVAMLLGGDSTEREVSLSSAKSVGKALDEICAEVIRHDPQTDKLESLKEAGVESVFNILHGGAGENGMTQAALELMGIPFTGSRHLASALALDKDLSKTIWLHEGLATPLWIVATEVSEVTLDNIHLELGRDLFVKPNNGGSSVATRRVESREDLAEAISEALEVDDKALVEECVDGQELTYAIVGDELLPGIRIEVDEGFYDYEAKYESDKTRYVCPPNLPSSLDKVAQMMSRDAFKALGCTGWGRVDLIASGREVFLLEINTIPGMTEHSLVPKAAKARGWEMNELVGRILEEAR